MATLGQELKRERELRTVSLEDIASRTKIGLKYLQALENDRLDLLPGTFFIKGVLRACSKCLGIDENDLLNKYQEEIILQEDAREQERRREEFIPYQPKKKRGVRIVPLAAAFLGIIVAAYFLFLRPGRVKPPEVRRPAAAPAATTTIPEPEVPAVTKAGDIAEGTDLKLELAFESETWIQVIVDGQIQVDGLKQAGQSAAFAAQKEIIIRTGNAGGVRYTLNGRPGKPLGAPGEVKTNIRIARDNLADYLPATEKSPNGGTPR
jgi:cytoskeletal protein RodZ